MVPARPGCLIVADLPGALVPLCGISILERLLRTLQRLGFSEATVLSASAAELRKELEPPSWARAGLELRYRERPTRAPISVAELHDYYSLGHDRLLVLRGDFYYDSRLLGALAATATTTLLIDSESPHRSSSAALIGSDWLPGQDRKQPVITLLEAGINSVRIDAAEFPGYVRDQRATVRPIFFPAPDAEQRTAAERVLQQAAQKGTLDIPAMVHAPIETWIVSKLWRTPIRPNYLSAVTMLVGLFVTVLYASGHLGVGVVVALAVGVLDGLDGKLARTKVETTKLGKWEHEVDYFVETTWWLALAYHFAATEAVPHAWLLWAVLFSCEFVDRATRGWIKKRLDRNLDDVSAFDRLVRLIGARRNIYTWILTVGLLLGAPAKTFVVICGWGIATAVVHVARGLQIRTAFQSR